MPAVAPVRRAALLRALAVRVGAAALLLVPLASCGGDDPIPIRDVRERSKTAEPVKTGLSAVERLVPRWRWALPSGWIDVSKEVEAPGRIATFRAGDDVEVSLSEAGGGLAANLDRWHKQMGVEPATTSTSQRPFMDGQGTYVDLSGKFAGGMGRSPIEDARLLGLGRELPDAGVYLKLLGPQPAVKAQVDRFLAFAASIRAPGMRDAPDRSVDTPPSPIEPSAGTSSPPPGPEKTTAGRYRFVLPPGWSLADERPMRVATFAVAGAPQVDVALSEFPGAVGGVTANVNRWRGQMGLDDVGDADVAKLPRIPMLGGDGVLVELTGHFKDSMRGVDIADAMLFGAIAVRDEASTFLKMSGPADAVRAQRKAFEALARSLERAR